MDKTYIIFTKGHSYFVSNVDSNNKKLVVYNYMKFLGETELNILEKMCVGATEFTLKEIIEYANSRIYHWEDEISSIVELGEVIYIA